MDIRWRCLLALLLLGIAFALEEDDVPDAGVDSDELSLNQEESRNIRPRAYTPTAFSNTVPAGFRTAPSLEELAGYQRPQQEQHEAYLTPTRPQHQQTYVEEQRQPIRTPHKKPQEHQSKLRQELEEELEEEKEEPDRLSLLLQQSKFDCVNKHTGYYADEDLNCEVFHYCQDNVKHSWICPDGFTFHQVHLICMPPNHDNICQKSSKYFFVNDYLYRPVNQEEVDKKPSLALKYSDRYYPSEVYNDDRYDDEQDEEEEGPHRPVQHHQPRPTARPHSQQQHQQQQQQQQHQQQQQQHQQQQVFRSAEEVNIPLVQRRPQRYEYDFQ